jgi:hypothetical protein
MRPNENTRGWKAEGRARLPRDLSDSMPVYAPVGRLERWLILAVILIALAVTGLLLAGIMASRTVPHIAM